MGTEINRFDRLLSLARGEPVSAGGGGPARILLVEDEEAVSRLTRQLLAKLGYHVTAAFDGERALQAYHESRQAGCGFNLIITDLALRGRICGRKVAEAVLQIDPNARVIVTSGYFDPQLLAEYRKQGFCGVLRKPYAFGDLQRAVRDALA